MIEFKRYNMQTGHLEVLGEYYDWPTAISVLNRKKYDISNQGFTITNRSRLKFEAYTREVRFAYYLMPE